MNTMQMHLIFLPLLVGIGIFPINASEDNLLLE